MRRAPQWTDFKKYPVVSATIVTAVVVTFACWSGKVDVKTLSETVEIRRGEIWRLLTSSFPHGDILHLAFNVYWTWVFGTLVEEQFGSFKTLAIFILLAVAANGAEFAVLTGGIGLSGIGYGLFGMLWVLSRRDRRFAGVIDQKTIGLFVAWFFFCIFLTGAGYPIGNVAHGVGAITGALLGWAIVSEVPQRRALSALLIILVIGVLVGVTIARPWINVSKYGGYEEGQLGYDALMAGRNEEAVGWLLDATRMQPAEASYWYDMGIAYDRLGRHSEAGAAYRRAFNLDPSSNEYRYEAQRY